MYHLQQLLETQISNWEARHKSPSKLRNKKNVARKWRKTCIAFSILSRTNYKLNAREIILTSVERGAKLIGASIGIYRMEFNHFNIYNITISQMSSTITHADNFTN